MLTVNTTSSNATSSNATSSNASPTQWAKRALAAGLLTLAPAFVALGMSPTSAADATTTSPITASHSTAKAPAAPKKSIPNGGVKHHHHHRHAGDKAGASSDES